MQTMNKTHVRPSRDLRNNYAEIVSMVKEQRDHVIITNQGRGDIVLIDFEDYAQYEQFLHQKYIDEKLREAEEYAQKTDAKWYSLEESLQKARSLI